MELFKRFLRGCRGRNHEARVECLERVELAEELEPHVASRDLVVIPEAEYRVIYLFEGAPWGHGRGEGGESGGVLELPFGRVCLNCRRIYAMVFLFRLCYTCTVFERGPSPYIQNC